MGQQQLSLDTLKDFDYGKAAAALEHALGIAVRDLIDRPGDTTARKVTLTIALKPLLEQDGDVVNADVGFAVGCSIPKWSTNPKPAAVRKSGHLLFQDMAPDNPDQMTIDEAEGYPNEDD
jgi:hypothetical protein